MILLSDLGLTVYAHYPQCNRNANIFSVGAFFVANAQSASRDSERAQWSGNLRSV